VLVKKTIVDIAKELNLSPGTISKIVNGTGRISSETRERVLKYVESSGYVAMSNARILSAKKSWTIGVIYSDISLVGFEHPFFSRILQSFKREVEKQGYEIVLIVSKLGNHQLTYLEWCRNKKVDGVFIVMGNINNPNIKEVVASDYPCVSADIVMPNLTSIISDDYMGMTIGIDHAISLGMKHIGVITGPLSTRSFYNRLEFYREIMDKKGMTYEESDIIVGDGYGFETGERVAELISKMDHRPEIYLVFSDVIAFGVIRGLMSRGIRVPEDISIVGYDDIDFAKHYEPKLTTIRQSTIEIGRQSALKLLDAIEHQTPKNQIIHKIPVELIDRETTLKKM
jgi:DNA-binding LacI/PurR family transcriptional regulator